MTLTLALVPLDERPACAALPREIGAVAGARALLPPPSALPRIRRPGDTTAIAAWLTSVRCDAAVVALETLGYGGLIASRTVPATVEEVTGRWAELRGVRAPVHAVTLVTRTPDSADAMEEPGYWSPHGPGLHRLSAHLHRRSAGQEPDACPPAVPDDVRDDFLRRRLRNHTLNLTALGLLADGTLDSLVIGADDTAAWGMATAELRWLQSWTSWLGDGRVAVRPGADEATAALVARVLSGGVPVAFSIESTGPLDRIAPYENMPVEQTARGQIAACGAIAATGGADVSLVVHVPDQTGSDWAVAPPAATDPEAADEVAALVERLLADGRRVAVADCGQPNGADPALVEALARRGLLDRLTAYAGWNTAGNTIGTAVAHAVAVVAGQRAGTFDPPAHRRLLMRRLVEDYGYMTRVRAAARARLGSDPARHDHVPAGHPVIGEIATALDGLRLPGFEGLRVNGVRLPWERTFEVEFDIEEGNGAC
ncbi:DUF4127 family protein [Nonomuraea mesophila]|uniref:DUF4127 family protein n=1 Tax=Nonomuraea mesophila TaxID=2530382 RepID=A0A4R5EX03_9ACTN|nr:DUF4127 family protein [Nonomuraea mesophila]TDE39307.1 DUF4127 family protein [Nonomuraea mesophila]